MGDSETMTEGSFRKDHDAMRKMKRLYKHKRQREEKSKPEANLEMC